MQAYAGVPIDCPCVPTKVLHHTALLLLFTVFCKHTSAGVPDSKLATLIFALQEAESRVAAARRRPEGAFGQKFPQNCAARSWSGSPAVVEKRVQPAGLHRDAERLDKDGLPQPGAVIWPGQTIYTTKDMVSGKYKAHKHKGEEVAHVEQVRRGVAGSQRWLHLVIQ